jgi:TrmH family RNA methyltransferase
MTVITSPQNQHLKDLRKLHGRRARQRTGRFLAEGEDLLAAADAAAWPALERYCAAGSGLPGTEVEPELLAACSTLGSGTRTVAVYEQRWAAPAGPLCVYLHGVRDAGNVGAVLRSALAFGAASVVLGPHCADPYGPRAVRASMGALFASPVARAPGVAELPGEKLALVPRAGAPLVGPAAGDTTLLVGAEREGLPDGVIERCDRVAHIPVHNESLNASVAAAVGLYELTRMAAR